MKYLIKNVTTGEETFCEKVVLDNHDYYYTKDKPINGGYGLTKLNTITKMGYGFEFGIYQKVIATTNARLDLPMVVDKEGELAENHARSMWGIYYDDIDEDCNETRGNNSISDYKAGYNKAKETYSFTKEDMVEFLVFFCNYGETGDFELSKNELFDIWQEQRPITINVK